MHQCFFCDAPFGVNDEIGGLPFGRRLAFDGAKGRLWIVCGSCGRWNLTPLEDRWETIDECERKFRRTQVRLSTDEIGMARLPGGVDLVRIGKPVLPEFAAWRYGNELLRRHRRAAIRRLLPRVGPTGLLLSTPFVALSLGSGIGVAYAAAAVAYYRLRKHTALRIPLEYGESLDLTREQVLSAELIRAEDENEQWAVWVACRRDEAPTRSVAQDTADGTRALLTGADGRAAAARILPHLNPTGGSARQVREAVHWLEAVGGPERALHTFARSRNVRNPFDNIERRLVTVHPEARLALEMALHEDEERRALRGDLTILRWAWRREEELAAIADAIVPAGPRWPPAKELGPSPF